MSDKNKTDAPASTDTKSTKSTKPENAKTKEIKHNQTKQNSAKESSTKQDKVAAVKKAEQTGTNQTAAKQAAAPVAGKSSQPSSSANKKRSEPADAATPSKNKGSSFFLISLLIIISCAFVAAGLFGYKEYLSLTQQKNEKIIELSEQVSAQTAIQNAQEKSITQLETLLKSEIGKFSAKLQLAASISQSNSVDMKALKRDFSESIIRHPNDWILYEIDYLIHLAGRKMWLEHDVTTALGLLSAASQRLMELNDSSLNPLRTAIMDDISTLESLPTLDPDGLVISLSNLEKRLDELMTSGLIGLDGVKGSKEILSSDVMDWQENLTHTWDDFVDEFISVKTRDSKIEALLPQDQRYFLKENLRSYLAKAEFAVYREQQEIYDFAMSNVSSLIGDYYDLSETMTAKFQESIKALQKERVASNYPSQFKSSKLLSEIMKLRVTSPKIMNSPKIVLPVSVKELESNQKADAENKEEMKK